MGTAIVCNLKFRTFFSKKVNNELRSFVVIMNEIVLVREVECYCLNSASSCTEFESELLRKRPARQMTEFAFCGRYSKCLHSRVINVK